MHPKFDKAVVYLDICEFWLVIQLLSSSGATDFLETLKND